MRLDAKDTLLDLGVRHVRTASSADQATAMLNKESCDAFILGLDVAGSDFQHLANFLQDLDIPTLIVASGISLSETLPRMNRAHGLSAPFDKASLSATLNRALCSAVMQPGADSPQRTGLAK